MRVMTLVILALIGPSAEAWGPGWGPGWYPGPWPGMYGGMGYYGGGYGMYGMGVIQTPSFNYTTTIVQSPPIIVNQNGETLYPAQDRGYRRDPESRCYEGDGR